MNKKIDVPDLTNYPHLKSILEKKDKFILDGNNNVIPANLMEWGSFMETPSDRRRVARDKVNDYIVSTVFIGVDHNFNWGGDRPHKLHIFETMVFKEDKSENYCDRYETWKEAEEGHKVAISWVKNGCKENEDEDI